MKINSMIDERKKSYWEVACFAWWLVYQYFYHQQSIKSLKALEYLQNAFET